LNNRQNRFWKTAIAAALFTSLAPRVMAGDASSLDVAGIKLGMSPSQVQSKIAQHFGVPVTKLKTYSQADFVVGNKPVIQSVSYGANGENLSVSFTVVSRDPAAPPAASNVTYEVPFSRENSDRMKAAALAKYGPPTINSGTLDWCVQSSNPALCDQDHGRLSLAQTKIELQDPRITGTYSKLYDEAHSTQPRM